MVDMSYIEALSFSLKYQSNSIHLVLFTWMNVINYKSLRLNVRLDIVNWKLMFLSAFVQLCMFINFTTQRDSTVNDWVQSTCAFTFAFHWISEKPWTYLYTYRLWNSQPMGVYDSVCLSKYTDFKAI